MTEIPIKPLRKGGKRDIARQARERIVEPYMFRSRKPSISSRMRQHRRLPGNQILRMGNDNWDPTSNLIKEQSGVWRFKELNPARGTFCSVKMEKTSLVDAENPDRTLRRGKFQALQLNGGSATLRELHYFTHIYGVMRSLQKLDEHGITTAKRRVLSAALACVGELNCMDPDDAVQALPKKDRLKLKTLKALNQRKNEGRLRKLERRRLTYSMPKSLRSSMTNILSNEPYPIPYAIWPHGWPRVGPYSNTRKMFRDKMKARSISNDRSKIIKIPQEAFGGPAEPRKISTAAKLTGLQPNMVYHKPPTVEHGGQALLKHVIEGRHRRNNYRETDCDFIFMLHDRGAVLDQLKQVALQKYGHRVGKGAEMYAAMKAEAEAKETARRAFLASMAPRSLTPRSTSLPLLPTIQKPLPPLPRPRGATMSHHIPGPSPHSPIPTSAFKSIFTPLLPSIPDTSPVKDLDARPKYGSASPVPPPTSVRLHKRPVREPVGHQPPNARRLSALRHVLNASPDDVDLSKLSNLDPAERGNRPLSVILEQKDDEDKLSYHGKEIKDDSSSIYSVESMVYAPQDKQMSQGQELGHEEEQQKDPMSSPRLYRPVNELSVDENYYLQEILFKDDGKINAAGHKTPPKNWYCNEEILLPTVYIPGKKASRQDDTRLAPIGEAPVEEDDSDRDAFRTYDECRSPEGLVDWSKLLQKAKLGPLRSRYDSEAFDEEVKPHAREKLQSNYSQPQNAVAEQDSYEFYFPRQNAVAVQDSYEFYFPRQNAVAVQDSYEFYFPRQNAVAVQDSYEFYFPRQGDAVEQSSYEPYLFKSAEEVTPYMHDELYFEYSQPQDTVANQSSSVEFVEYEFDPDHSFVSSRDPVAEQPKPDPSRLAELAKYEAQDTFKQTPEVPEDEEEEEGLGEVLLESRSSSRLEELQEAEKTEEALNESETPQLSDGEDITERELYQCVLDECLSPEGTVDMDVLLRKTEERAFSTAIKKKRQSLQASVQVHINIIPPSPEKSREPSPSPENRPLSLSEWNRGITIPRLEVPGTQTSRREPPADPPKRSRKVSAEPVTVGPKGSPSASITANPGVSAGPATGPKVVSAASVPSRPKIPAGPSRFRPKELPNAPVTLMPKVPAAPPAFPSSPKVSADASAFGPQSQSTAPGTRTPQLIPGPSINNPKTRAVPGPSPAPATTKAFKIPRRPLPAPPTRTLTPTPTNDPPTLTITNTTEPPRATSAPQPSGPPSPSPALPPPVVPTIGIPRSTSSVANIRAMFEERAARSSPVIPSSGSGSGSGPGPRAARKWQPVVITEKREIKLLAGEKSGGVTAKKPDFVYEATRRGVVADTASQRRKEEVKVMRSLAEEVAAKAAEMKKQQIGGRRYGSAPK
jgi:hypothetical protein